METAVINQRRAIAVLIAMLCPAGIVAGIFGTICIPLMTKTAMVVYPLFDIAFAYGIWWSYKNGGFED